MSEWKLCANELPGINVPVWVFEDGRVYLAELVEIESENGFGYSWARVYGEPYLYEGKWTSPDTQYDDDYDPTQWHFLPEPPHDLPR